MASERNFTKRYEDRLPGSSSFCEPRRATQHCSFSK